MPPNLKIVRDDSVLHVVDSPRLWHMTLGTLFLILTLVFLAHDWTDHETYGMFAWHILGVVAPLIGFFTYMSPRDYEFDKAARKLTWRRRWVLWVQGGELPFKDITDATLKVEENKIFGRKVEDCQLILRTNADAIARLHQGRKGENQLILGTEGDAIVICHANSSEARSRCEEIAARIREVLRNPKA